ncbi:quinolinate synthase NadA [Sphingobacterium faecium]|jgi:quinolinate synthase|uniref:quinolinate synthase NadA n=1 Tax=Sphingobacterium faecium TaxID=34087 RepID=UPI0004E5FAD4|nr:quinolinate synthase NadA [Sphingobacterium faecium]UXD69095.1 quinolinate synthase NadA [Sphingobacterium faecium]WGQ16825.1 quinolinate synthase NadA [Sphingobacterium faecium]CDT24947.1 Quinolinate synthase A [Sphingobacterium sp. PM2-P1-29]SJN32293.1 Quinolinate synthetase [Sphingobacterium faecium PCAi_F2.5]
MDLVNYDMEAKGYIDAPIDPSLDLIQEIKRLKKEKNAVILAHYYQEAEIQDIADYIGDSLGLSQEAAKTDADVIVFAGVHFMAETAKILSPTKKVLLPDAKAGCSLSDSCPPHLFAKFKEQYPDHLVITYVNCTAELKALSDIVCTSSNAVEIVESLPLDQKIIFGPDRNLGAYVKKKTGRDLVLWNGACMVHEIFSQDKIDRLRAEHPEAKFIAHPECEDHILATADYVGSTSGMLKFTINDPANTYIVATESGIIHQMQKASPGKTFIPAPPNNACACNDCPHMKLNTLEKLYNCLKYESPEITLDESVIARAQRPIERMLEISAQLGL